MHKSAFLIAAAALAAPALADLDYDVSPKVDNGAIVLNAFFDAEELEVENVAVFGYLFGEDPLAPPNELDDPGFHPLPGSGFTDGSQIGLDAQSVLQFWNGAGSPGFAPAGAGVELSYRFGGPATTNTATVTGTSVPSTDVLLGPVDSVGEFDDHLITELTLAAPSGVYLFSSVVNTTTSGVSPSGPAYFLFGYGVEEAVLEDAKLFVRDSFASGTTLPVVPEPAVLPSIAAAASVFARRRR